MSPPAVHMQLTQGQLRAIQSPADITVFGGGNGGGKTGALQRAPLRDVGTAGYRAVLFMESLPKVKQPGGILDESQRIYAPLRPRLNRTELSYAFPCGAEIKLSYVGDEGQWDGLQAAFIGIDQVEQVSERSFWAVVGRRRTVSGVKPRVFCTCNPPPEGELHWLTRLLDAGGYLDDEGYPRTELDGVVRYVTRDSQNAYVFADTPEELEPLLQRDRDGHKIPPYSFTFVQALVDDNHFGDPTYKTTLAMLPEQERLRRLYGKWKGLNVEGIHFKREYFPSVEYIRSLIARGVRAWDNAWATSKGTPNPDGGPDWTVGVRMWQDGTEFLIDDVLRCRGTPAHIERAIFMVAELDGPEVIIRLPKDPGAALALQSSWADKLGARGYTVLLTRDEGDKLTRAQPYIACAERRQIKLCQTHPSREIAHRLLEDFEVIEACFGCRACRRGDVAPRCDGAGVYRQILRGLKEIDVGTLQGWQHSFVAEHVRFGIRGKTGKLLGKKDSVDGSVGAYLVHTDPARQPMDDFDTGTRELVEFRAAVQTALGSAPRSRTLGLGRTSSRLG